MKIEMLDQRRFFRNRFERLFDANDADGSGVGDGSAAGLRELCEVLAVDNEWFPLHYNSKLRWICGREADVWFSGSRSYGDVARLVMRYVEARERCERRPATGWVHEVVHQGGAKSTGEATSVSAEAL
jgi:hypothetical protein